MSALSRQATRRREGRLDGTGDILALPGGLVFAAGLGAAGEPIIGGVARGDASPPDSDDAVLAESLRSAEWFGEIYRRYFREIYRYVASRLGPDAAEDLAAEAFLAAFRRRHSFDPERGAVRPWLYGIATNVVAQHRRVESRMFRALAMIGADRALDGHEERVAEQLSAQSLRAPLAGALARLPARDRDVLLLMALGDLSYDEIAFALSIPKGTVGSRLSRARRKLARALGGVNPAEINEPPGIAARGDETHG